MKIAKYKMKNEEARIQKGEGILNTDSWLLDSKS